ncbi:hypothetical protein J437_LFUL002548 [Ladona fulva]|uniref:Tc1-like transposase DDE domain-containing protein n=1 Tax=Ladona fulva TaxID=123851 RepID=A0A8K0KVF7_LADFU|nr:hypothetical protein J437_LFUL002548 [Ladona fulva]
MTQVLLTLLRKTWSDRDRESFWNLLKEICFQFEKKGNKALLIERSDIIVMGHLYLRKIRKYSEEDREIIYLDETWVNEGHTTSKSWHDSNIKSSKQAMLEGLSTGLKRLTGRGPRFVILSAGSNQEFVENARLVYPAKKNTGDYHDEMDSRRFEEWFKSQLLLNIKEDSVVVMNNESYYSRKQEKIPISSRIEYPEKSLKIELIKIVDSVWSKYTTYEVDKMAKEKNIILRRLPRYHCKLNPIELVWSQLKRYIAVHNISFHVKEMQSLIEKAFEVIATDNWASYCQHVQKDDVEPLLIKLTSSSSSGTQSSQSGGEETLTEPGPSNQQHFEEVCELSDSDND